MDIAGIKIERTEDKVTISMPDGPRAFTVADVWNICQELGANARQAQQHAAKSQAERAGVTTSEYKPRKPED